MQELWTQKGRVPPAVILLEVYPKALTLNGYVGGMAAIVDKLHAAEYASILHSGFAALLSLMLLHGWHEPYSSAGKCHAILLGW